MKKIVLIPSYEPDEKLIDVIKSIDKKKFEIIVVNDGSSKKYDKIFDKIKNKVHYISYEKNKGKGYALKKGLKYINDNYKDYVVVTMDGDGQHKIEDADKLLEYASNNKDTIVIGKRNRNKKIPLRSKIGNEITSKVFKLITLVDVYDTQSGLRAFSKELIPFLLKVNGNRFEYEMNVLLLSPKNNIKLKEIDIQTIYIDDNKSSHFNALKDSYRICREIFKYSIASFLSFIIDYIIYIISTLFLSVICSNIIARIISCNINYYLNKKIVFNNYKKYSYLQYIILVLFNLLINTFILNLLVSNFGYKYLFKVVVELIMYILNYYIQKNIIFKK